MPGPYRNVQAKTLMRLERMRDIQRMERAGIDATEIAGFLGVPLKTVQNDLTAIRNDYRNSIVGERGEIVAERRAQYYDVLRESWAEWQKSKLPAETTVTETEPERPCPVCDGTGKREAPAAGTPGEKGSKGGRGQGNRGRGNGSAAGGQKEVPCFKCEGRGILGGLKKTVQTVVGRNGDPRYLGIIKDTIRALCELEGANAPKDLNINGRIDVVNWEAMLEAVPNVVVDAVEARLESEARGEERVGEGQEEVLAEDAAPPPDTLPGVPSAPQLEYFSTGTVGDYPNATADTPEE